MSTKQKNFSSWLFLAIAIGFMWCIFAPLNTFFTNENEFWFSFKQLIPALVGVWLVTTAMLIVAFLIFCRLKKASCIYCAVLCSFLYFYIQGNYVPRNYGVLNGVTIDWASYKLYAVISILLILAFILLYFVLIKKIPGKIYNIGKYLSIFLLLIQFVTLGVLFLQSNAIADKDVYSNDKVVTRKDLLNLSKDNNIIVLLLDTFDEKDMEAVLNSEKASDIKESFEGFTYYPDTLGAYPTTKAALPQILTGVWYENDKTYNQYVQEAYVDNPIYDSFANNRYKIGAYTNVMYLDDDSDMYLNVERGTYKVNNYKKFIAKIFKLEAFNYMPHQLKKYFYIDTSSFDEVRGITSEWQVYSSDVQSNYKLLIDEKLTFTESGNLFKFVHTDGVHAPATFGEDLISDASEEYGVFDEALGNCMFLKEYFDQMKDAGVYDKSTIIVLADHGHYGYSQNPLFMIKNVGETHDFKTSEKEMSYEFLADIFIELANGGQITEGFIDSREPETGLRRFMYYSWDNSWNRLYMPDMVEMYLNGIASDSNNLKGITTFLAEDKNIDYKLGDVLLFNGEDTGRKYVLYGVQNVEGGNDGNYSWTIGNQALFKYDIDEEYNNLKLKIKYVSTYPEQQDITAYANNNIVAEFIASGEQEQVIIIPHEYVADGILELKIDMPDAISPKDYSGGVSDDPEQQDITAYANNNIVAEFIASGEQEQVIIIPHEYVADGILELKIDMPDAISPKDYSGGVSDDPRVLALALYSISIESTEEEYDLATQNKAS